MKADYEPQSPIWKQYPSMAWEDGKAKNYLVPWTPRTTANADELLKSRQ